ncbi:MAG: FAD-dependent oxidoreductase, partial [Anaerolineae bacterium]
MSRAAIRLPNLTRGERFTVEIDGESFPAHEGETVASVLLTAGSRAFSRPAEGEHPNRLFCGMGLCHQCLVTVDGMWNLRACMTKVHPGMQIETRLPREGLLNAGVAPATLRQTSEGSDGLKQVELAIVGGGPAGMAAAIEATAGGASVVLIDAYEQPGGHYFKPLPTAFQPAAGDKDERRAELRSLMASASRLGVEVLTGTTVWGVFRGEGPSPRRSSGQAFANRVDEGHVGSGQPADIQQSEEKFILYLHGPYPIRCVVAKYLILATGAYDRPMPFPGWTLPGVITPGAAQMLLRGQGILPGQRVLVAGSGPLPLAVGAGLVEASAHVVGVLDIASWWDGWRAMPQALWGQRARWREAWQYWRTLRARNVPILFRHAIFRALGEGEVQAAAIGKVDAQGRPLWHTQRTVDVDTICVGFGFLPSIALSRHVGCQHVYDASLDIYTPQHDDTMRTNVPRVFVAGDVAGVGGSDLAMLQGRIAGLSVLGASGHLSPETVRKRVRELSRKIDREERFLR